MAKTIKGAKKMQLVENEVKKLFTINLQNDGVGLLRLTPTMLNKSIIDANKSIQKFALLFGVDFEALKCGEKRVMEAEFVEGDPCKVTFYKAKTRGDRRVSITKLKANAEAGDLIALGYRGNKAVIFVYNVTQQQVREA
tara:strand:+ start:1506 stop:1922 length:417 start_codon:yes stop_codon:yes gene_type:complete